MVEALKGDKKDWRTGNSYGHSSDSRCSGSLHINISFRYMLSSALAAGLIEHRMCAVHSNALSGAVWLTLS